jgi:hypothetical protein
MEIKIDVKPEDITKMVSEAVLKSSIGDRDQQGDHGGGRQAGQLG